MRKLTLMLLVAASMAISGCAFVKENIGSLAGGASAVATAPLVQKAIADCVADDLAAQEKLAGPNKFFSAGYEVIKTRGANSPIVPLIEEFADYYAEVPEQWAAVWVALDGKECGAQVERFRQQGEDAWASITKAVKASDRIKTACAYYSTIGPIAAMFSPIPLPSRIPGCA